MSAAEASLIRAARRMTVSLQKETALASLGALGDLAEAADAKEIAFREFAEACAARGRTPPATDGERNELRRVLAAADENALILEAVSSTLQHLAMKVRAAAATIADPGTYAPPGRPARRLDRHVLAARVDASV
jgi:ferric-dicitrate binding protein FerR (iron transport regulator)